MSERKSHLLKVTELGPEPIKCSISYGVCKALATNFSEILVNFPHGLRVHECQLTSYRISGRVSQRLCLDSVLTSCQPPLKLYLKLCRFSPAPPAWTGAVASECFTQAHSCSFLLSNQSGFLRTQIPPHVSLVPASKEFPGWVCANLSGNVLRWL